MIQTFEQELYEAVGRAFPGLTVRAMSRLLGKSSGYWSSMTSQNLTLPTDTLMHLVDVVECQKILLPLGSRRACQLESVQGLLCEEISTRLSTMQSYLAGDLPIKLEQYWQRPCASRTYEPLPFLVSTY